MCPRNGNLLALAGSDGYVKVYDRRVSRVVETFDEGYEGENFLPTMLCLTSIKELLRASDGTHKEIC